MGTSQMLSGQIALEVSFTSSLAVVFLEHFLGGKELQFTDYRERTLYSQVLVVRKSNVIMEVRYV